MTHGLTKEQILSVVALIEDSRTRFQVLARLCDDEVQLIQEIQTSLDEAGRSTAQLPAEDSTMALSSLSAESVGETEPFAERNRSGPAEGVMENLAGQRMGAFRLISPIGQGGMGTVFLAEQHEPVKRRVAVKVIRSGVGSRDLVARFNAERQALALMEHPGIAKFHDAGTTESGLPYFVMEYVLGLPVTQFCDEHCLSVEDRLSLFRKVCLAVQHAHQKGIIHRDLKSSNVLVTVVDGEPAPKIIDFGLAKATGGQILGDGMETNAGQILGTLCYMSPEQMRSSADEIDTRTDIYALGAILYEVLTGCPPFDASLFKNRNLGDIIRMIRDVDPPSPSARFQAAEAPAQIAERRATDPARLSGLLEKDLEWIVMKSLEKDRERRYQTANELAMDVQRFLSKEEVVAAPPSAAYRLKKFYQRNKAPVLASAAVLMFLLLGITGTTGGMLWAFSERNRARSAESTTSRALADRQGALEETRATIDQYVNTVSNADLLREPRFKPLLKDLLADALRHYERFIKAHEGDHTQETMVELASSMSNVAQISAASGDVEKGLVAYENAIGLWTQLVERASSGSFEHRLANCLHDGAMQYASIGQFERSTKMLDKAAEIHGRLANAHPSNARYHMDFAKDKYQAAKNQLDGGDMEAAVAGYQTSVDILNRFLEDHPDEPDVLDMLTRSHLGLGESLYKTGKASLALRSYETAMSIAETSTSTPTRRSLDLLLRCRDCLAEFYFKTGQLDHALDLYRRNLPLHERIASSNPNDTGAQIDLSGTYSQIATVLSAQDGKQAEAIQNLQRSLQILEQIVADNPTVLTWQSNLAGRHANLGELYASSDPPLLDKAVESLEESLRIHNSLVELQPGVASFESDLAQCLSTLGAYLMRVDPNRSMAYLEQSVETYKKLVDREPTVVKYSIMLGGAYVNQGHVMRETDEREMAVELYSVGADELREAFQRFPEDSICRTFFQNALMSRALMAEELGLWSDSVATWEELLTIVPADQQESIRQRRDAALEKSMTS